MNKMKITSSTRKNFECGMMGHNAVAGITHLQNDIYRIVRTNHRPELRVLIADIYICGEADIIDITNHYYDLDCIVLVGFYNRYSCSAKQLALLSKIGLFNMREFYGALNFVGSRMLNYVRSEK